MKYCPHCLPSKRLSHKHFHAVYYLNKLIGFGYTPKFKPEKQAKFNTKTLWPLILNALALVKIVKFDSFPRKEDFLNRSLIFFNEAEKRNIDIRAVKIFGRYRNDFRFTHNRKYYHYEGIPLFVENARFNMDNKPRIKALLEENNIPVACGDKFVNKQKAVRFAFDIGWPVVVKPCFGSLSQHVTCNISSENDLLSAIRVAKIYRPDFIVEKHIPGNLYRTTVVGKNHVFCCHRERANVVGNGLLTIKQLINEKNKDTKRGHITKKNTTLHEIIVDDILDSTLKNQGLALSTVLASNKKVYLHHKHTVVAGCDIIGVTDKMHLDNKELFLQVAKLLNTSLVGIDFICPDITKSHKQQETAVLETNSLPYIDMHQETSHGSPDNVAKIVWDVVLN